MFMKKIYIAIAVVLLAVAGVATVLAVRSHNRMDDFFRANVEALTNMEDAVQIGCDHYSVTIICKTTCSNCGKSWTTLQGYGHAVGLKGKCTCGKIWY